MVSAGHSCGTNGDVGHRGYAGVPFYRPDDGGSCVYLSPDSVSVCDGNTNAMHSPLCYCNGKHFEFHTFEPYLYQGYNILVEAKLSYSLQF